MLKNNTKNQETFLDVYFTIKIKTESEDTRINFKNKQTTPLFKIRSMQSLLQGKMFNSIGKNIFLIFYLSKISFKKVKIK